MWIVFQLESPHEIKRFADDEQTATMVAEEMGADGCGYGILPCTERLYFALAYDDQSADVEWLIAHGMADLCPAEFTNTEAN